MKKIISLILSLICLAAIIPSAYAEDAELTELNKFATFTTDAEEVSNKVVTNLQQTPGDANKYMILSAENIADTIFPVNIDIDFGGFDVEVKKLVLYSRYGISQGISNIDILIRRDGEWAVCRTNIPIKWRENAQTAEEFAISNLNVTADAVRIRVNDANRTSSEVRLDTVSVLGRIAEKDVEKYIRPVYFRSRRGYPVRIADEVAVEGNDGVERKLKVSWNNLPDGGTEGTYLVSGKVTGSDVAVKAVIDVYEQKEIREIDGWARLPYTAAKKAGYLTGVSCGPYDAADADTAAKIIVSMLNLDLQYPKNYRYNGDIFRETVYPFEKKADGDVFTRLDAITVITNYAKTKGSYIPNCTVPEFIDSDDPILGEALSYNIISNGKYARIDDKVTTAEIVCMCFGLKRNTPIKNYSLNDNGESISNANSGFVSGTDTDADIFYLNFDISEIKKDGGYNFGYTDTALSDARNKQKKIALYVSGAEEADISKLAQKYAQSGIIEFIDSENEAVLPLWKKYFPGLRVYTAGGTERENGRFSFSKDNECRIYPESISFFEGASRDEGFIVHINWKNNSFINYGEELYPALTLKTQKGNIAACMVDDSVNLGGLSDGDVYEAGQFRPHAHLAGATYKAYISLGTITGQPSFEMPAELENDGENRYYIGDITLWPSIYVVPHDGIDENNSITVDIVRNDYFGEYFSKNNCNITFLISEKNKPFAGIEGGIILSKDYAKTFPDFMNAVVRHDVAKGHKVKIDFDAENLTLRGAAVQKEDLAGKVFDVYAVVDAYGQGDFVVVTSGWHTMQNIGTLSVDENLECSFTAKQIDCKNE